MAGLRYCPVSLLCPAVRRRSCVPRTPGAVPSAGHRSGAARVEHLVFTVPPFHRSASLSLLQPQQGHTSSLALFHPGGKGTGFSYFAMQVLAPSVTPDPAELNQYKLGICSFTPLTRDINLCFSNPWPWRPPWKPLEEGFPGLYPSLVSLNGFFFPR